MATRIWTLRISTALPSAAFASDRAYVQSPVCGPSRASFYTGRTVFSHGSTWNFVPLPIGELTLGDYLRPIGVTTAVVGKTHMIPDKEGMARLGLNENADIGCLVSQPGFDPYERDDGLHPNKGLAKRGGKLRYNDWLREQGYEGENPWNDYANSGEGPDGEVLSGWYLKNSNLPARVKEEHSETAYMTMRAKEFITEMGDTPWLCHLSFIKPHWPYIAPAPYHDMYRPDTFLPVKRDVKEKENPNPVFDAFMRMGVSETFSRQGVRETVLPAYMGLIKQIDDHLGRLFDWLEETEKLNETMIVFTSDHGDYLGDHWMGEKELFHEMSVRVPLIIVDPRAEADATRGTVSDAFVESIDLVPTFMEATGAPPASHRLEGRSLMPLLHGPHTAGLARCCAFRNRLCVLCRPGNAVCGACGCPGLHAADRKVEIRPFQGVPATAFRSGDRPGRIQRSRTGPRVRNDPAKPASPPDGPPDRPQEPRGHDG